MVQQVEALAERVALLEAQQHPTKLLEWVELAERLQRYLSRLSAVEQRIKQREEGTAQPENPVTAAVLRSKFPQLKNGA